MASVTPTKDTEEIQKITAGTPPSDLGQSENTSQDAAPKSGHGDAGPEVSESYRSEEQSASTADVSDDLNDRSRLSMAEKLKISEAEMREQVLTMFNNEIELEGSFNRIKDDLIKFLPAYLVDQQLSTLAELSTKSDPTKKRKTFAELFNPSEEYSAYLNQKAQKAVSNTETTRDNNEVPADESDDQSIEGSKSVEDTMRESILPMFTNEQIDEPFNKMKNTLIEKLPGFLKEQLLEALMQLSSKSEPTNRKRTLENLLKPSAEYLSYSQQQPTATTTLQQEEK